MIMAQAIYKQNNGYFSVPWENMSKHNKHELGSLTPEQQAQFQQHVNRMNADLYFLRANNMELPEYYRKNAEKLVKYWCDDSRYTEEMKKNTEVTIAEENFVLDREKARSYYKANVGAQIFQRVTSPLGFFQWDLKQYLLQKVRGNVIKFGRRFENPRFLHLKTSHQSDSGMGWYMGYKISRWDLLANAGEFFDMQYETILEAANLMGRAGSEHVLTGTTCPSVDLDDSGGEASNIGLTGFTNNANLQDFTIATPTTYNNVFLGVHSGLADLKTSYAADYKIIISTSGLAHQVELNENSNTDRTEKQKFAMDLVGPGNHIKEWWVADALNGVTQSPANTAQAMVILNLDPRLMDRKIVLGLQTIPFLKDKGWADDIQEVMVAADILRYKIRDTSLNAFPGTKEAAVTTTDTGIMSDGRFM
jgi:hypothetical protein